MSTELRPPKAYRYYIPLYQNSKSPGYIYHNRIGLLKSENVPGHVGVKYTAGVHSHASEGVAKPQKPLFHAQNGSSYPVIYKGYRGGFPPLKHGNQTFATPSEGWERETVELINLPLQS